MFQVLPLFSKKTNQTKKTHKKTPNTQNLSGNPNPVYHLRLSLSLKYSPLCHLCRNCNHLCCSQVLLSALFSFQQLGIFLLPVSPPHPPGTPFQAAQVSPEAAPATFLLPYRCRLRSLQRQRLPRWQGSLWPSEGSLRALFLRVRPRTKPRALLRRLRPRTRGCGPPPSPAPVLSPLPPTFPSSVFPLLGWVRLCLFSLDSSLFSGASPFPSTWPPSFPELPLSPLGLPFPPRAARRPEFPWEWRRRPGLSAAGKSTEGRRGRRRRAEDPGSHSRRPRG